MQMDIYIYSRTYIADLLSDVNNSWPSPHTASAQTACNRRRTTNTSVMVSKVNVNVGSALMQFITRNTTLANRTILLTLQQAQFHQELTGSNTGVALKLQFLMYLFLFPRRGSCKLGIVCSMLIIPAIRFTF